MDPTAVLILGVLWFLLNLLSGGGKKKGPPPTARRREPPQPVGQSVPDATQREGSRLEKVLREFQRTLEEAEAGPAARRAGWPLPHDEDVEEGGSLEREPHIISLEQEVPRPARREFTQDQDAESLVQRRIDAATSRDTAIRAKADRFQLDERIRQEAADRTATAGYTARQLRDAVVWREILGPPVSETWSSGRAGGPGGSGADESTRGSS